MPANDSSSAVHEVFTGEGHREFIRRRLKEISSAWTGRQVSDAELIAQGIDNRFWELVGLRVRGNSALILGAVEFRRQSSEEGLARESLPSYLASNQSKDEVSGVELPGVVAMEFPMARESVQEFLGELVARARRHRVLVDKSLVDVMFDLRAENPSVGKRGAPPRSVSQTVALRTRDGHLLSGNLLDLEMKLRREIAFLALTRGVQHTVHGNLPLPTVFLNRRYLSMLVAAADTGRLEDQLDCVAFQVAEANPTHLLLGD